MGQASARRVVARFLGAMEHDSPKALQKYLREHPDADLSKHTVKGDGEDEKTEEEIPDFGGAAKKIWESLKSLKQ